MSLAEVHDKMLEMDLSEGKKISYTRRYLKTKLEARYKDTLSFTSEFGKSDILTWRDQTFSIIRKHYELIKTNDVKKTIIESAAELILNDIKRMDINKTEYPSVHSMADPLNQLFMIPLSLQWFLDGIVKDKGKVTVWGQNIISMCRPRSGILPRNLALAIQLDHKFGSKWLIEELHSYGYCVSYSELQNYKYCHLKNKEANKEQAYELSDDIVQFVGDNIDLNIVSKNGNNAFHNMGVISVNPISSLPPRLDQNITRV